jgi:hypothetical protein
MDRVDIVHAASGTVVVLERRLGAREPRTTVRQGVFAETPTGTTESWRPG